MSTTTATRVTVKDLAQYDLSRYQDPHPSAWATETVLRDEWEPFAFRREVAAGLAGWDQLTFHVEQLVAPGSTPHLRVTSADLFNAGLVDFANSNQSAPESLLRAARDWLGAVTLDRFGRRLRPGILELLAEHLETDSDMALAAALNLDEMQLTLGRSGFAPFSHFGYRALAHEVTTALERLGLSDRSYGRSWNLAVEGQRRR